MQASDHSPAAQLPGRAAFPHRHLTGIAGLQPHEIVFLLDEAEQWVEANRTRAKSDKRLEGLTQINAFFENSTRTLLSFEIAGKRLGADVVNMHAAQSSVKKGETLIDTAVTLNAMRADVIVIRHMSSGAVDLIAEKVDCPVLNAGDGWHEHPTQALLDALTIRRRRGSDRRPARGDLRRHPPQPRRALEHAGADRARRRGPRRRALDADARRDRADVRPPFTDFDAALEGADVVMMLRVQNERMAGGYIPSTREYPHALRPYSRAARTCQARCAGDAPGPDEPRRRDRILGRRSSRRAARSPNRSRWASRCAWRASTCSRAASAAWRAGHEDRFPQRDPRLPVIGPSDGGLLIEGDTIVAVGEFEVPADAARVDLAGKTLAPALIDLGVFAVDQAACRAGGIARVGLMPDQSPVLDDPGIIRRAALSGKPDALGPSARRGDPRA